MEKDRDRSYNGSYLYKLNEELSGQAELDPYFITSQANEAGEGEAADDEYEGELPEEDYGIEVTD